MKYKIFIISALLFLVHKSYAQIDTTKRTLFRFSFASISNKSCSHYRHYPLIKDGHDNFMITNPSDNPNRYYGYFGSLDASFKLYQPYLRINLGVDYTFSKGRYGYNYNDIYKDAAGTNIVEQKNIVISSSVHRVGIQASLEYRFLNALYFNFGPSLSYQLISKDVLNGYEIHYNVIDKNYTNTRMYNYNKFNPVFISIFLKTGYDFKVKTKSIGLFVIANGFFDYRASYIGFGTQIHL